MLISEMGNCGNFAKLERINTALTLAKDHNVTVAIFLDPNVYGSNVTKIYKVENFDFNKSNIIVNGQTLPWWDIVKVSLIF